MDWCKSCDSGLPLPDRVFYMDIDVTEASTRGDFGDERYEVLGFQKKVQEKFKQLKDETWKVNWRLERNSVGSNEEKSL